MGVNKQTGISLNAGINDGVGIGGGGIGFLDKAYLLLETGFNFLLEDSSGVFLQEVSH